MNQSLSDLRNLASVPLHTRPKTTISRGKKHADLVRDPVPLAVAVAGSAGLGTDCEITVQNREGTGTRFALQTTSRAILDGAPHPKSDKGWRIAHCQRSVIKDALVSIKVGPNNKSKFAGLQSCGSVWCCPVCAHKVSRLRELEIAKAMNKHFAAGGGSLLVTYTHPHKRPDGLKAMMLKFASATKAMTGWRAYKTLLAGAGYDGRIRAQEVTFGFENGWHNHTHEAWLIEKHLTAKQAKALESALFPLWKKACLMVGLPAPSRAHGVDVRIAYSPQEYITKFSKDQKWGTGAELAKSSKKKSEGRFTPFDFLRAFQAGHRPDDMRSLFREFAFASFNARQIHWSKGLKKRMGIDEKTDEELAAEVEAKHVDAGTLSRDEWRQVIDRPKDIRAKVLRVFDGGGMDAVHRFIARLDPYSSQRRKGGGRIWTNLSTGEIS